MPSSSCELIAPASWILLWRIGTSKNHDRASPQSSCIEGSTALWERDQAARRAVDRHLALLDAAIAVHGGHRYQIMGDGVQAAFATAHDALAAAMRGGGLPDCPREELMEGAAPFLRRAAMRCAG